MKHFDMLLRFLEQTEGHAEILHTHTALYAALFFTWRDQGFRQPLTVYRSHLMARASISSTATYHKCLTGLIELGYIAYEHSYDHFKGSQVTMLKKEDHETV